MRIIRLIVVLVVGCLLTARGQFLPEKPAALERAGVKHVRCMLKDRAGLIWIGTSQGLYRFDGTNVDYIRHELNQPSTIPPKEINTIAEDAAGRIWIGTNQGVAVRKGGGRSWKVYSRRRNNLGSDFDNKVYISRDGQIWAGNSAGLFRLNARSDGFVKVWGPANPQKPGMVYVTNMTDWKGDTLAAGTFNGLVLINKRNFGYRRIALAPGGLTIDRLYTDECHRIWAGTWGCGIFVSDTAARRFTNISWEQPQRERLANVVTGLLHPCFEPGGVLWVSTTNGLYRIRQLRQRPVSFRVSEAEKTAEEPMIADSDRYIWTGGNGVSRIYAGERFFKPFSGATGLIQEMTEISIRGKRLLAAASWHGRSGLSILDESNAALVYRQPDQADPDGSAISGTATDRYGRIWIAGLRGIRVMNRDWQPVPVATERPRLLSPRINAIVIIHDTVWISEYKKGVELFDLGLHRLRTFLPDDGSGLADNLVNRFFTDAEGRVWLCGNSRLYLYRSGRFAAYNFNEEKGAFCVNDITELGPNQLAIASSTGLFRFNPVTGRASRITTPLLPQDDDVMAVARDAAGSLWYCTSDHLVRYGPVSGHFTVFGAEDGLQVDDDLLGLRSFNGRDFYLARRSGILRFNALQVITPRRPMRVYLHALQIGDLTVAVPPAGTPLRLSYRQNRLLVEFGAVNYIKPGQNRYAYRLSPGSNWVYTTHNTASFNGLPPGKYKFELQAANSSGLWSSATPLRFIIAPPFWATWWFRLLAAAALLALVFFAIRYILRRNYRERILSLEKERAVERERNRIAVDMHDDLGSGLTKIAILSELAMARVSGQDAAQPQLETISAVSRELVDSLQNIVWLLKPQNDSLESLTLYIRRYVNQFFDGSGIMPVFDMMETPPDIRLSEEQRRNIFLVVKEACHNIIRHACATAITIRLSLQNRKLVLQISDNGRGFDRTGVSSLSNGLRNMQARMAQIGGGLEVSSVPGSGTTITVQLLPAAEGHHIFLR